MKELEDKIEVNKRKVQVETQGVGELVKNPIFHSQTKHIDIRHHFVREVRLGYEQKRIEPKYIGTEDMIAYVFTKALFTSKHQSRISSLGIKVEDSK